jgi:hypothetical protein
MDNFRSVKGSICLASYENLLNLHVIISEGWCDSVYLLLCLVDPLQKVLAAYI